MTATAGTSTTEPQPDGARAGAQPAPDSRNGSLPGSLTPAPSAARDGVTAQDGGESPTDEPSSPASADELIASLTESLALAQRQRDEARAALVEVTAERDAATADASSLREKLTALRAEFDRDGHVFAIDFKTDGAMYARETIHQRAQGALSRVLAQ